MSRGAMTFEKSLLAQGRLHQLIPGAAQTYARGSDQFPEKMAPILVRGRGARVKDLDGNWLIEFGMGLRSVKLGHACPPLVDAVCNAAADGVNFSRPSVWRQRSFRSGSGGGDG
jgi:glutamate-1-semialdehyde 2,1-aminomutase